MPPTRAPKAARLIARRATLRDQKELGRLLAEMLAYYKERIIARRVAAWARILCRPRGSDPFAVVCARGDRLLGFAIMDLQFPADDLTRALFMKDLYVEHAARRSGVGRVLLQGAAQAALHGGYTRLDWSTARNNLPARKLYLSIGAERVPAVLFRLKGDDLKRVARA
jgi:GNAT superfamily N-acetyltransferase